MSGFDINNDVDVAGSILNDNDLFYYNQTFYTYKDNYWSPILMNYIKIKILEILGEKYKQGRVNNIIDIMQLKVDKMSSDINLNSYSNLINVQNGMYNLKTNELQDHSVFTKKMYSTNLFPINYNNNSSCPTWMKFVYEIFEPDEDMYDKIALLQEYLGYCLTQDVQYQKALLLLGNGSNGKSIILQILEQIVGKENYSNIELHQLSNKNYIVELQNKHVNFCSEIESRSNFSSAIFKRIVGGETLTGDAKFKHPIKFQPYCKLLFATNDLPITTDTTRGYFRRLMILKFNRSFEGKDKDTNLINKLKLEIDGIFNWFIEGLNRLYENKGFTIPASSTSELTKYLESSNSVVAFINEKYDITPLPDQYVKYDELYTEYKSYCADSGNKPFKKNNFRNEIEKQFQGKIVFNRTGLLGNHFTGIKRKL